MIQTSVDMTGIRKGKDKMMPLFGCIRSMQQAWCQ